MLYITPEELEMLDHWSHGNGDYTGLLRQLGLERGLIQAMPAPQLLILLSHAIRGRLGQIAEQVAEEAIDHEEQPDGNDD